MRSSFAVLLLINAVASIKLDYGYISCEATGSCAKKEVYKPGLLAQQIGVDVDALYSSTELDNSAREVEEAKN